MVLYQTINVMKCMYFSLAQATRQGVTCPDSIVRLHCKLLELALEEWEHRTEMGSSYTNEIQKQVLPKIIISLAESCMNTTVTSFNFVIQLFADVCVEDPRLLVELCVANGNRVVAAEETRSNPSELRQKRIQAWTDVLQV